MNKKSVVSVSSWILLLVLGCTASPAWSASGCGWSPELVESVTQTSVWAAVSYDDGSGPALYVAGRFLYMDGILMNNIARWDGTSWSALVGPLQTGTSERIYDLAVWDDGSGPTLYAGGDGGVDRWDGTSWSVPGGGAVGQVNAMATYDDGTGSALFTGGDSLQKWNGSVWQTVAGAPANIYALAVYDVGGGEELYVGGSFTTVSSMTMNNIARWDGSQWQTLAGDLGQNGVSDRVRALAVYDDGSGPGIYAGGQFLTASGVTVNRIARWDGAWSSLSGPSATGVNDTVYALAAFDDGGGSELYVGGALQVAGIVGVNHIASWNGTSWSSLTGSTGNGTDKVVLSLGVYDEGSGDALYAGGDFDAAGGVVVDHVARWDGVDWSALESTTARFEKAAGYIKAAVVWDDGGGPALYVGGSFSHMGGVWAYNIAKWDGTRWSALSGPLANGTGPGYPDANGTVFALAVYDDGSGSALYAGGFFYTAGGVLVNHVAKWDGSEWSALESGGKAGVSDGTVRALATFDDGSGTRLYVGGNFVSAGGISTKKIAVWDGVQWSAQSGFVGGSSIQALKVWDDGGGPALFIGGTFVYASAVPVNYVVKWDGSSYTALQDATGTGTDGPVYALAVYDDGSGPALYLGGSFDYAGGWFAQKIARWDGAAWANLSPSGSPGVLGTTVYSLASYGNDSASRLYAGGLFSHASGQEVNNVVAWDGSAWSALTDSSGTGTNGPVYGLGGYDSGSGRRIWVGGSFSMAGGISTSGLASYGFSCEIFADGFESGDTTAWPVSVP